MAAEFSRPYQWPRAGGLHRLVRTPTYIVTLVSLPAASAPAGLSKDGLPIGMQIAAPRFEEPLILRVARRIQRSEQRRLAGGDADGGSSALKPKTSPAPRGAARWCCSRGSRPTCPIWRRACPPPI